MMNIQSNENVDDTQTFIEVIISETLENIINPQEKKTARIRLKAEIPLIIGSLIVGICGQCGGKLFRILRSDGAYLICSRNPKDHRSKE